METLDQLLVLRDQGWQYAQGHLFDRPFETEAFGRLLLTGHVHPVGAIPARRVPRQMARPPAAGPAAGLLATIELLTGPGGGGRRLQRVTPEPGGAHDGAHQSPAGRVGGRWS